MKRLIALFVSVVLTAAGVAAQAQTAEKPTVIRIAYSGAGTGGRPSSSGNILATAAYQGVLEDEFRKDGIRIEWNFYPGAGPATNEAAANGLVDFAYHGDLPLIVGRSTGIRHHIILALGRFGNTYFVVPSDSSAQSIGDLKGKKIATFKGTAGQLTLNRVLEKYGFTEKDFRVISLDSDTTKTSLATRSIDGTIISPFDVNARGISRTLFEIPRDPNVTSVGTFWVSEDFEKKYPDIVQRVVNRLVQVAYWSSDEQNRAKQFQLWAQDGTYSYTDWVQQWKGYTLKERNSPLLDEYYRSTLQRAINEAKKFKLVRGDVDLNGWIEPKYLETALKQQHLETFWDQDDANGNLISNSKVASQ
jgi:sulfonate transport system substrate-binding protein